MTVSQDDRLSVGVDLRVGEDGGVDPVAVHFEGVRREISCVYCSAVSGRAASFVVEVEGAPPFVLWTEGLVWYVSPLT